MRAILQYDRNPAYPTISIGGTKSQKNVCGGILGLMFWTILLTLFIMKAITVFGKRQVKVETFLQRDMSPVQIHPNDCAFSLSIFQQTSSGNIPIGYKNQSQFGFEVTMVEYFVWYNLTDGKFHNDVKLLPMVACEDEDFFCVPQGFSNMSLKCQPETVGTGKCNQTRYYDILIRQCKHDNPNCSEDIPEGLFSAFGFYDNTFDVFEPKTDDVMGIQPRAFFTGAEFNDQNQYVLRIYLSKLVIETDQSISPALLPLQDVTTIQTWFYPNQDVQFIDSFPYSRHRFMTYQFRRSYSTEQYKRNYEAIDTMLAQILGFMGLIAWLVAGCCAGYNQYLMEEHVYHKKKEAQQVLEDSQQNIQEGKSKLLNKSFVRYWKSKIINIFAKNQREHEKQIDVMELYKKIMKLQKQVLDLRSEKAQAQNPMIKITPQQPKKPIMLQKQVVNQKLKESLLTEQERRSENK